MSSIFVNHHHEEDVSKLTETSQSSASKWTGFSSLLTPTSWQLNRCSDSAVMEHVEEEVEIQYTQTPMFANASPWRIFSTACYSTPLATVESDTASTVPSDEENEDTDDADFLKAYIESMETFLASSNKHRKTISAKDSRRNTNRQLNRTARINALGQVRESTPKEAVGEVAYENQSAFFVNSDITGDSLLAGLSLGTAEASIETVDASNTDKKKRILGMHKSPQRRVQVLVPTSSATATASEESVPFDEMSGTVAMSGTATNSGTATTQPADSTNSVASIMIAGGIAVGPPPPPPPTRKRPSDPPKKKLKTLEESTKKKNVEEDTNTAKRSLFRKLVLLLVVIVIIAIVAGYSTRMGSNDSSASQAAANGTEGSDNGDAANEGGNAGDTTGNDGDIDDGSSVGNGDGENNGGNGDTENGKNAIGGASPTASNGARTPVAVGPTPQSVPFTPSPTERTPEPTPFPTPLPTPWPTSPPTDRPTTPQPTPGPSNPPPTQAPTTREPTWKPTTSPTKVPPGMTVTYVPGKLTVFENGLRLSEGLKSRIIARTGDRVEFPGNKDIIGAREESSEPFHVRPDGAEVFADPATGGWAYVSNSEAKDPGQGGVGAIYFDPNGDVVDYKMLLQNTTWNCAGGKTPWDTWVSCEEIRGGTIYQVDPFDRRAPEETTMGKERGGFYESFAYDIRDNQQPRFFATEDHHRGTLRRFTPSNPNWSDPWSLLHGEGVLEYMHMTPNDATNSTGTFQWTTDFETARNNAFLYFQNSEGLDVNGNQLYAVCKYYKELFIFNLDDFTYTVHSTQSGIFDGMPDQMKRLVHDEDELLYICEEGGGENGVHARNSRGWFFTIFESAQINDETTGLAFSPDQTHLYAAYQETGLIFDIWREDGLPFNGRSLNVRYHDRF